MKKPIEVSNDDIVQILEMIELALRDRVKNGQRKFKFDVSFEKNQLLIQHSGK